MYRREYFDIALQHTILKSHSCLLGSVITFLYLSSWSDVAEFDCSQSSALSGHLTVLHAKSKLWQRVHNLYHWTAVGLACIWLATSWFLSRAGPYSCGSCISRIEVGIRPTLLSYSCILPPKQVEVTQASGDILWNGPGELEDKMQIWSLIIVMRLWTINYGISVCICSVDSWSTYSDENFKWLLARN
jgi:hypothetical protein